MRVCIINSFYPPWVGGAETYVSNLAERLVAKGNRVVVYCAHDPLAPGETRVNGVIVRRMRAPLRLYGTPIAVSPINIFAERHDVVHCNFPSPYLSALFAAASKATGVPAVLTWHNDLPRVTSAAGLLVAVHDFFSPVYLDTYRRIIATTEIYARTSKTLQRYAGRVRVIPNGVDTRRFSPLNSGEAVRRAHNLEGKTVLLFVGAMTPWHSYKGVEDLLGAFKIASQPQEDLRLLLVGSGALLPEYTSLARSLSIQEKVVFAGKVSDALLPSYYAASDFVILPSKNRSEGFGLVLLEAMASGKPVIGSDVGGVTDVIQTDENGILVEAGAIESLAAAIGKLAKDERLRAGMAERARQFAEDRDWSKTVKLTEKVYEEAIGGAER